MKLFAVAIITAQVLISQSVWAAERTTVMDIENMTCALCPFTVSRAIESVSGVSSVKVSLDDKTATVIYDDGVAVLEEIADASTFAGYPATHRSTQ